jgi:UDP-N-acetylglucosamine 2-epimerase (non-hydrolysing)
MIPFTLQHRNLAVVLGTRPEIIKLAPLVKLLGPSARVIHTGQHYDPALSENFLLELGLGRPQMSLGVGGRTRGEQIGLATDALARQLTDPTP